jgi:hypothetical protein
VETPQFIGAYCSINFPMPTAPPGAQRDPMPWPQILSESLLRLRLLAILRSSAWCIDLWPVVEETESGVLGTPISFLWLCMHRPVTAAMCCVQICCAVVEAALGQHRCTWYDVFSLSVYSIINLSLSCFHMESPGDYLAHLVPLMWWIPREYIWTYCYPDNLPWTRPLRNIGNHRWSAWCFCMVA